MLLQSPPARQDAHTIYFGNRRIYEFGPSLNTRAHEKEVIQALGHAEDLEATVPGIIAHTAEAIAILCGAPQERSETKAAEAAWYNMPPPACSAPPKAVEAKKVEAKAEPVEAEADLLLKIRSSPGFEMPACYGPRIVPMPVDAVAVIEPVARLSQSVEAPRQRTARVLPPFRNPEGVVPLLGLGESPEALRRVIAYLTTLVENARPPRLLYSPEEAAYALAFTHSAFRQSDWHREIPVRKVGNLNRYRPQDLKVWVDNLPVTFPRD